MIVVHHLESSRSQRVLWMLEELGLDYEIEPYQRQPSMQAPPSLRAVGGRGWFAGADFSAADIQMSFPIEVAAARAGLGDKLPRLKDFIERIQARTAYKRAPERGGLFVLPK